MKTREQQVREIADREAIKELTAKYAHRVALGGRPVGFPSAGRVTLHGRLCPGPVDTAHLAQAFQY
jgi:hypothetical protein